MVGAINKSDKWNYYSIVFSQAKFNDWSIAVTWSCYKLCYINHYT